MKSFAWRWLWLIVMSNALTPALVFGRDSADLAVYDFTKGVVVTISSNRFREVVIDASPKHTTFFTFTRLQAPKLVIRERGADGAVLSETELPFFVSGYAGHNWIRMSPERKRLVFYEPSKTTLNILSLQGCQQRELLRGLCDFSIDIFLMRWLSENTVLLVIKGPGPLGAQSGRILKIDVDSGETQTYPRSLGHMPTAHALSESGELLAIAGYDPGSKVSVLDVRTMKAVKELPRVRPDQWIGDVYWVDDDKRLALWDVANGVFCYTMTTGELKSLPPQNSCSFSLVGSFGKYVILSKEYVILGRDAGKKRSLRTFQLHDVVTGRSTPLDADLNGCVYGIANNTKLVLEVGY